MPRLSEKATQPGHWYAQAGAMVNDITKNFGFSRQTIHNLNIRFAITGSVRDRPRPGQCRVTSQQDDRYITLTHLRNRFYQQRQLLDNLEYTPKQSETVLGKTTFLFELVDRTLVRFSLPTTGCYGLNVTCIGPVVSGIT